jgi:alkyl hydroperoxide reductase subunit AhpC
VLFFYPLDFTFVCPTEIIDFSDAQKKFESIGAAVIGASVDSHFTHQGMQMLSIDFNCNSPIAWTEQKRSEGGLGDINIPLLADLDKKVSQAYGAMLGNSGHTLRATYIIDNKGV